MIVSSSPGRAPASARPWSPRRSRPSRPAGWRCSSPRRPASRRTSRATSRRSRGSSPGVTDARARPLPRAAGPGHRRPAGGAPALGPAAAAARRARAAADHDLVLVEGAGGLLVRFDDDGGTLADVAAKLAAPVLVVATRRARHAQPHRADGRGAAPRGLTCAGVVVGAWPADPDLAARCNLVDLPAVTGVPLLGALPAGAGRARAGRVRPSARHGLAPALGGTMADSRAVTSRRFRRSSTSPASRCSSAGDGLSPRSRSSRSCGCPTTRSTPCWSSPTRCGCAGAGPRSRSRGSSR